MENPAGLVERAARGDRDAWATIWDEHAPALHRYARRLLDQDGDAADAVADTFVAAAQHLGKLRDPDALRPWLYAICKREVQRQWRGRARVSPVEHDVLVALGDDAGGQAMTGDHGSGLDAQDAASLIWDAAEGLSAADRELLALTLANDLDSAAAAKVAGVSAQSIHVRVSRLKDALGKSAGALLVARRHRGDCADLQSLLAGWDGIYSTVWRKRVARHIEGCAACADRQRAAAGALFALAPAAVLVLPWSLRESVLDRVSAASAGMSASPAASRGMGGRLADADFGPDGFPAAIPWAEPSRARRRRGAVLAALAAALVALGIVTLLVLLPSGSPPALKEAAGTALAQPGRTLFVATASPAPSSATPEITAEPTPEPTPEPTLADEPDQPADEQASEEPSIAAPPPPLPAAPSVSLLLSQSAIQTACGSPTTSTASTLSSGSGVTTVISWNGTAPGSAPFAGEGSHSAVVGPFVSVPATAPAGVDSVTVTATVTDEFGRTASASQPLTVSIAPC